MSWILLMMLLLPACGENEGLVIIFGGDVMLDRGIRTQIEKEGVDHVFTHIRNHLKNADCAVVNLECPATEIIAPLTKKFTFRADPAWLPGLREAGITHCILANNHSYDQGRTGLVSTAGHLKTAGIQSVGFGMTQDSACAPIVIEKNGVRVAIFSSVILPLESWMYLENEPGMCQATIDDLKESIAGYRKKNLSAKIIVTLHWGLEYRIVPTATQRQQAKGLVESGADAIIGHHPHVIQSFERIGGKPVFYSLGNLVFDSRHPAAQNGMLVSLRVSANGIEEKLVPYHLHHGIPVPLSGDSEDQLIEHLQKISDPLPQ